LNGGFSVKELEKSDKLPADANDDNLNFTVLVLAQNKRDIDAS
tara:strand:- start:894 stop:1022 length:129 start_codon:yes stop_codon:yes gene_type:complete